MNRTEINEKNMDFSLTRLHIAMDTQITLNILVKYGLASYKEADQLARQIGGIMTNMNRMNVSRKRLKKLIMASGKVSARDAQAVLTSLAHHAYISISDDRPITKQEEWLILRPILLRVNVRACLEKFDRDHDGAITKVALAFAESVADKMHNGGDENESHDDCKD